MNQADDLFDQPLFKLVDGDVLDFSEDHWSSEGCPTCNYGSSYAQDFTVVTTRGNYRFQFSEMYNYSVSHQFLLRLFLQNTELIKTMTIKQFYAWLVKQFKAVTPSVTHRKEKGR